jgi:hypothetical protein
MKPIVLLFPILAFFQDKSSARIQPLDPVEDAWPVGGTIDRPDDSIVEIFALRIERQWSQKLGTFREGHSVESRIWARALVTKTAFRAELPKSAPGFYQVRVCQEAAELHSERLFLGRTADLSASWAGPVVELEASRARLLALLDLAEKISKGEKKPGSGAKKDFMNALSKEDRLLDETIVATDFTATSVLLRDVVWNLRNAQIWKSSSVSDDEAKFLDPATTFGTLRTTLESAQRAIPAELRASVATLLVDLLRRAQERPARNLAALRHAAVQARKALDRAQDLDKDFRELVSRVVDAEESSLKDLTAAVEAALGALVAKP